MRSTKAASAHGDRAVRRKAPQREPDPRTTLDGLVRQLSAARLSLEELREHASIDRELAQAYRQFSELYDFLPIAYLLLDERGLVQRINESGVRLFGLGRSAIVGRPLLTFFSRNSTHAIAEAILRPPVPVATNWSFEARLVTLNASPRVRLVWRRVETDERGLVFHLAIIDITEARELQEQTRRAEEERERSVQAERLAREASEAKDQFLATLSHELRTPLTPILSAVDSLKDVLMRPEVRSALNVIRRNVRAEARLIDDLLDVARITQKKLLLKRQPVDLHEILLNAAADWKATLEGAGIGLSLELHALRRHVLGDPARLGQVCRNLISNAVKFSDVGSRLTITSSNTGRSIAVSMRDTGIGMSNEQAIRVFEPFVQLSGELGRHSGLGLGLVICRGIVDAHDGTIYATSEGAGHGTTVVFELPVVTPPSGGEAVEREPPNAVRVSGKRVLLVEDHADSARMLSLLLMAEGYDVTVARSKREGLLRLADCDLVISDIGLPDGTGLEFMAEARTRQRVAGIALSGFGSEQDIQRSLEAGFAEHLTKPIDFDRLLEAMRRL
jgi:PAS domain S-box-containing protein